VTITRASGTAPRVPLLQAPLRHALRADGICSAVAGAAIIAAAGPLSAVTGIPLPVEYGIGLGFLLYGVTLLALAQRPKIRAAGIGVAIANALGTLIALVVVVAAVPPLTAAGVLGVVGIGLYTAGFAVVQYRGARRLT